MHIEAAAIWQQKISRAALQSAAGDGFDSGHHQTISSARRSRLSRRAAQHYVISACPASEFSVSSVRPTGGNHRAAAVRQRDIDCTGGKNAVSDITSVIYRQAPRRICIYIVMQILLHMIIDMSSRKLADFRRATLAE